MNSIIIQVNIVYNHLQILKVSVILHRAFSHEIVNKNIVNLSILNKI